MGLVEGGKRGLSLLAEAVEVVAGSPARLEHAKARTELGAALHRANRRSEARDQVRQGLDLATLCGAAPLAARAETELRATGARPRRIALRGVESLTPSERRVAELAAGGPTNREIAQAPFVTQRTVEVHLTSVYRKLDITSRSQLAAALDEPTRILFVLVSAGEALRETPESISAGCDWDQTRVFHGGDRGSVGANLGRPDRS